MNNLTISKNILFYFFISLIFVGVAYTSFYKLSESPQTWTDEGLIIQTSQNLVGQGKYGFQIAPGKIISPSFISTSYPVTYPIALSFSIFGISLINARYIMALYILSLLAVSFLFLRGRSREEVIWSLLLVSTFPPLYGQGKNVLGEVPGLVFILLSALFIQKIEQKKDEIIYWILFGLSFGLALVTKPIFILAIPAVFFVLLRMFYKEKNIDITKFIFFFISGLIPVLLWVNIQFYTTDSWFSILKYYSNPHSVDIVSAVSANIRDFIHNPRTLFFAFTFFVWVVSLLYSLKIKKLIHISTVFLFSFSLFVFVLYFRNPPYYRYFFLAEVLSLLFFSSNLFELFRLNWQKNLLRFFLCVLVVFQFHQLYFSSWISGAFSSNKTKIMTEVISSLPNNKTIYIYQAPEAVVFLKHYNYYQYFSGTITTEFGEDNLDLIKKREDLLVLTKKDLFEQKKDLFSSYKIIKEFDRYVIAGK